MTPQTFLLLGRSGCGKGTQAKLLIEYLEKKIGGSVYYLQSGEVFRSFIKEDGLTHSLAKDIYDRGDLMPEFLSVWVWSNLLIKNMKGTEHLMLDGMPRKQHEALVLESAFYFYKRDMPHCIYINVGEKWARERLSKRGRQDDVDVHDVEKRLGWFYTDVLPAIDYYRHNPKYHFIEINGEQEIEKVHKDIVDAIKDCMK